MRNRALRPFVMIISLLLVAITTVQAGPISIGEVVQVVGSYQNRVSVPTLRLRGVSQSPDSLLPDGVSAQPSTGSQSGRPTSVVMADGSKADAPAPADSLLAGVTLNTDDPQTNIDVITEGDLEGSICDCGEIPSVHHHFPLWPLLFLALIPLFFIHHHNECTTCSSPSPTPTPTPPPPPPPGVPEPASLFLLGSGLVALGAGLRRRHARGKLAKEIAATKEA